MRLFVSAGIAVFLAVMFTQADVSDVRQSKSGVVLAQSPCPTPVQLPTPTPKPAQIEQAAAQGRLSVAYGWQFFVVGWHDNVDAEEAFSQPVQGARLIAVKVLIVNEQAETQFMGYNDVELIDNLGRIHQPVGLYRTYKSDSSDIVAGTSIETWVGFWLPTDRMPAATRLEVDSLDDLFLYSPSDAGDAHAQQP